MDIRDVVTPAAFENLAHSPAAQGATTSLPILPVLMAGGSGSRLWPLSRESYPKQFLNLTDEHSLLQNTVLRSRSIEGALPPVVIGSEPHRFLIAEQLRETQASGAVLLLEPEARDTAPAAAVAAHFASASYGPETVVLLMAADHTIADLEAFRSAVAVGARLAADGEIVTFGIRPTRAETGFGYLRCTATLDERGAVRVDCFVEKPDAERATAFIKEGGYYWNSGMFMFRADRFLKELDRLQSSLSQLAHTAMIMAKRSADAWTLNPDAFCSCPKISVDYAVMEQLSDLVLVPLDAGWDDLGSWNFMSQLPLTDNDGNCTRGDVLLEDSSNNLVHAESRLVALVGVEDHVVVETGDAILVAPRGKVQDVKRTVEALKRVQRPEATRHSRVHRPWGSYESIAGGDRFQVKRIVVKPGEKLSLQMHHHRAEHWVVVKGTARVTCGEREFLLTEDRSTYIPLGEVHRLENPGVVPLELIEVQSGVYLGEDDIVRYEDIYGRSAAVLPRSAAAA